MAALEFNALVQAVTNAGGNPQDLELRLDIHDRVGEWFVLAPTLQGSVGGTCLSSVVLTRQDSVSLEITSGTAEVREDPYRGFQLLRPTSAEPVEARVA